MPPPSPLSLLHQRGEQRARRREHGGRYVSNVTLPPPYAAASTSRAAAPSPTPISSPAPSPGAPVRAATPPPHPSPSRPCAAPRSPCQPSAGTSNTSSPEPPRTAAGAYGPPSRLQLPDRFPHTPGTAPRRTPPCPCRSPCGLEVRESLAADGRRAAPRAAMGRRRPRRSSTRGPGSTVDMRRGGPGRHAPGARGVSGGRQSRPGRWPICEAVCKARMAAF